MPLSMVIHLVAEKVELFVGSREIEIYDENGSIVYFHVFPPEVFRYCALVASFRTESSIEAQCLVKRLLSFRTIAAASENCNAAFAEREEPSAFDPGESWDRPVLLCGLRVLYSPGPFVPILFGSEGDHSVLALSSNCTTKHEGKKLRFFLEETDPQHLNQLCREERMNGWKQIGQVIIKIR